MKTNSYIILRQPRHAGFTLIELVVVLAIAGLIFAFGTPYAFSAMQAASLTSVGDTMVQKISQAQQRAVTENRVTALQFYFYEKDGLNACHAVQLVSVDPATNAVTALEEPVYWSDGRVLLLDGPLSPLFVGIPPADAGDAIQEPFMSLEATFRRIRFYPGGGTSLTTPLRQCYLTLVNSNKFQEGMTEPPRNYYTIQIDPIAGRSRSYRP